MKYELFILVIFLIGMLTGHFFTMVIAEEIRLEKFVKEVGDDEHVHKIKQSKKNKPKKNKLKKIKSEKIKPEKISLIDEKAIDSVPFVELISAYKGLDDVELLKEQENAIDSDFECNELEKVKE